jgi:GT2 family glycosyltransferase
MKTAVIVPNWNGADYLSQCIESLLVQTQSHTIIIVDNGSVDESRSILESYGDKIVTIYLDKNYGFTGGVNPGLEYAIKHGYDAAALFNNDAVADPGWLKALVENLGDGIGITTSLILSSDGKTIDTTGDILTTWGLPYPRSRGKLAGEAPSQNEYVFGASGGASIYRIKMLESIGLFDQDFFAYYEDVDISFRAQLSGWKVLFVPSAKVFHRIGATSSRVKGFTSYHTFKNMRLVILKNTPKSLRHIIYPRFFIAYSFFQAKALFSRNAWSVLQGSLMGIYLSPKKIRERKTIMAHKTVSDEYILSILTHDLPENSTKLRKMRALWWKVVGKSNTET